jgi:hypothetical protein
MTQQHSHAVEGAREGRPASRRTAIRTSILWTRLLAVVVLAALAFVAGWTSAPRQSSVARIRELESDLARAHERITELESVPHPWPADTPPPTEEERVTERPPAAQTYVVRPGDSLQLIADRFYEDPTLANVIARANDIDDPALIHAGQLLKVPRRPEL